jgi:molybdate transport system permease protein
VNRLFGLVLTVALGVTLAFLLLPLIALFLRVPPGDLFAALGNDTAVDALVVSVKTSLVANFFILAAGTPAAYFLATRRFRGRNLVITLVELPLVLPPAVAGIGLLATFGRRHGLLGGLLDANGVSITLTQTAVVLAIIFVASPFYLRTAIAAFSSVDPTYVDAARTLGASPSRTFWRVALPLSAGGLSAGAALAFARGLGEFGATIMFAGSLQGVTQTLPLAIYAQLDLDFDAALAMGALLVLVSLGVLLFVKLLPSWTRFASISLAPSAPSSSR